MNRQTRIFQAIKEMGADTGATASQIARNLQLDRANVSHDLNNLYKEGKLKKSKGRPIYFSLEENGDKDHILSKIDTFTQKNPSLHVAIEQGKAAILYPPKGLHTIIMGETGAGKSMFARMMHSFGLESGRFSNDFVSFNCADYSNNAQLLLSHLFGVKKGAYTGAVDQEGLIEKADQGILFLDEVHRLPPEGQEMFFKFLDDGTFRKLGEADQERSAKVMIICATSENAQSSLLQTFIRRIPMVITIPPLRERSEKERYEMIKDFFKEEAIQLGKEIFVSANTLYSFLYYPCPNNVGQLKNDIQLACARAYADFITEKKERIQINSTDLNAYVREGLAYRDNKPAIQLNHRYYIFSKQAEDAPMIEDPFEQTQNIYDLIERKHHELTDKGLPKNEINTLMDHEIEQSFTQYINSVKQKLDTADLLKVIDVKFIKLSEKIIQYAEERLQKRFDNKITLGLALHIHTSIERLKLGKEIMNPKLNSLRTFYKQEFWVALESLRLIEEDLKVNLPIDEAGYLTMFFKSEHMGLPEESREKVPVIVMMHGNSTASSMADTVNQLLNENYARSIDMPLHMSTAAAYESLKKMALKIKTKSGLLLLVDMGSLVSFGEKLQEDLGVPVRTIDAVSTPHVLEIVRKAVLGYSLDELYGELMTADYQVAKNPVNHDQPAKLAIVTACLTGHGSAKTIKNALKKYLSYDKNNFEFISINISERTEAARLIHTLSKEKRIVCIVSHFHLTDQYPQFSIEDVVRLKGIKEIQTLVDQEQIYLSMEETLHHHLEKLDARKIVPDIRRFLETVQEHLNTTINKNDLIGIVLHISCMLDRLNLDENPVSYSEKATYIENNKQMFNTLKEILIPLEKKYALTVPDDEICYIMNFFEWALEENQGAKG
ncbi:sigma 54-interacting transcriptional regulator [Falsibacillus albus]|uniref:Sigma-54-dependent transcriptional regulator n=1 Tax=Falsibacillus albus TaxID=2478915 RepID=A0A3L7JXJ5_9BACI|nr:sigma-54-dependent transcriptional regulator [Falsibacillus albus]RLQ94849.1 sigma-54-dependent transcriptional regulator [Falsibacillus albus]